MPLLFVLRLIATLVAPALASFPNIDAAPAVATESSRLGDVALIAAIEDYTYESMPDVPGARANAEAWAAYLRARGVGTVKLLLDADVTETNLVEQARALAGLRAPEGRVWLVFVGHGAPGVGGGALVTVDAQATATSLRDRGVAPADLAHALGVRDGVELFAVVDACFSGRSPGGVALAADGALPVRPVNFDRPGRSSWLVAAAFDQFAGPLPGLDRPAFSWLALGALRGWADRDGDHRVTGGEVVEYTRRALVEAVSVRRQEPQLFGDPAAVWSLGAESAPTLAAVASVVPVPPRVTGVLARWDFEQGNLDGWASARGQWTEMDGTIAQNSGDRPARALAGDDAWADYAVDFDFQKIDGPDAVMVVFRAVDGRGGLQWTLGGWGNTAAKLQVLGDLGGAGVQDIESTRAALSLEAGRTYHVRLEVRGARVVGYVGGAKLLDVTDPVLAAHPTGRVGLGTWQTRAWFDNVTVTALPPSTAAAGQPGLPQGSQRLYGSDFTQPGLSGFAPTGGQWYWMDGRLAQQAHAKPARAMVGDTSWRDYAVEFDVHRIDGRDAILVAFRAKPGRGGLQWVLGGWGNKTAKLEVLRPDLAGAGARGLEDTARPMTLVDGRTYHVRLEVRGAHVMGWVDGVLYLDITDPELGVHDGGGLGLGTWETRAWFDNVTVTALGAQEPAR